MPPVNILIKPASSLCNMRCRYCFYNDEAENRQQKSFGLMPLEVLETAIKKTLEYSEGECTIGFQGGEPTLAGLDFFKKAVEFEKKYNVNRVRILNTLQTNGYLIDNEWADFLRDNDFLTGLSLDGIKDSHDSIRKDGKGAGTFYKVMAAAELMKKRGAEFNLLTVVGAHTAPKIGKIYEFYKKYGLNWQQYIACLQPLEDEAGDWELSARAYGEFLIKLFELWDEDYKKGRQPYIRQFENYVGIFMGYPPESCEQNGTCGIQYVMEADGSVYPCDFYMLDDYRLGNIMTESFSDFDKKRYEIGFIKQSAPRPEKCRSCLYYELCRNGCRRNRDTETGLNRLCEGYMMFFEKAYPRLKEIAVKLSTTQR
jgi:uncharacterized protein